MLIAKRADVPMSAHALESGDADASRTVRAYSHPNLLKCVSARQRVHVGMVHAGRTVTVEAADHTFRVYADDKLLADVARTTTKPIARFKVRKPEPARHRPVSSADHLDCLPKGLAMKLPAGATGFDMPTADEAEVRAFISACHHAARATDGAVTRVTPAGPTPNFHTIEINHGKQRIAVLRHAMLPVAAFADPRNEGDMTLKFIDRPGLAAALTDVSNIQILTAAQLNAALSQADLGELSPAEHNQIAHWQPTSIGELLFNFWD